MILGHLAHIAHPLCKSTTTKMEELKALPEDKFLPVAFGVVLELVGATILCSGFPFGFGDSRGGNDNVE